MTIFTVNPTPGVPLDPRDTTHFCDDDSTVTLCGLDGTSKAFRYSYIAGNITCLGCLKALNDRPITEGRKDDDGKPAMDLLPPDALMGVGEVLAFGRKKYAARNWELGMAWGRLVAALLRHLCLWLSGKDIDKESGLHHLAHCACCALMLYALVLRKVGTDDRKVSK